MKKVKRTTIIMGIFISFFSGNTSSFAKSSIISSIFPILFNEEGENAALSWSGNLADGEIITITTDGTYDFLSEGPRVLFETSLSSSTAGQQFNGTDYSGTDLIAPGGDGYPDVVVAPDMPNGLGLVIGGIGPNPNSTDFGQIEAVDTQPSTGFFEHNTFQWPAAAQAAALKHMETYGSTAIWQCKFTWFYGSADGYTAAEDADSYAGVFGGWYNTGQYWIQNGANVGNKSSVTYLTTPNNLLTPERQNGVSTPVIRQRWVKFDQVPGQHTDSRLMVRTMVPGSGFIERQDEIAPLLKVPSVTNATIDRMHMPGYVRGNLIDIGAHWWFGDSYYAVGTYPAARVEITNNAVYDLEDTLTICIPLTWTNDKITARIRTGMFKNQSLVGKWLHIHVGDNQYLGSMQLQ